MDTNQKGFANIILIAVIVILVGAVGYFAFVKKPKPVAQQPIPTSTQTNTSVSPTPTPTSKTIDLKTYTNSNPTFSFKYPSSWNQPVINQQSTRIFTDFRNGFSVTTGLYYDQVKGRNSTVLEIINGYKNSSTIKNVQTENIKVDGHLATKITYYGSDTKKNYTDVHIYQDQQIQEKFIELTADDSVDATIFNQILSTFKFTN